ncbi:MAG: hypothetical protein LBT70_03045 [Holosporaceae bacterium]|jgi:hypothetical protein|nr:hypothetical protein [Holosporaceae bacterium]
MKKFLQILAAIGITSVFALFPHMKAVEPRLLPSEIFLARTMMEETAPNFGLSVQDGLALASYGVNTESVARNAGKLVAKLLKGSQHKNISCGLSQNRESQMLCEQKIGPKVRNQDSEERNRRGVS